MFTRHKRITQMLRISRLLAIFFPCGEARLLHRWVIVLTTYPCASYPSAFGLVVYHCLPRDEIVMQPRCVGGRCSVRTFPLPHSSQCVSKLDSKIFFVGQHGQCFSSAFLRLDRSPIPRPSVLPLSVRLRSHYFSRMFAFPRSTASGA